jgi:hypothetical protein
MKRLLILLLLAFNFVAVATAGERGIIIGFRGINGIFDNRAFESFAKKRHLVPIAVNAEDHNSALWLISTHNGYYELYGYSLGAKSIKPLMDDIVIEDLPLPGFITTIGAYHTHDVDFRIYGVPFKNYFDASGRRNTNPGRHIPDVKHIDIQKYVNICEC